MENIWRGQVVERALQYVNHKWYATNKNVRHGFDSNQKQVDTPDVTWVGMEFNCGWWNVDEWNQGIPYCWGNVSTIEEFEKGLQEGKYAGNVPENKSLEKSVECVGIDCSGLLTVCWNLPDRITTRDIPIVAQRIESIEEIRQGDIFVKRGSHIMIFHEFASDAKNTARIIDSTRRIGKVSEREVSVAKLFHNGYEIYRKK